MTLMQGVRKMAAEGMCCLSCSFISMPERYFPSGEKLTLESMQEQSSPFSGEMERIV